MRWRWGPRERGHELVTRPPGCCCGACVAPAGRCQCGWSSCRAHDGVHRRLVAGSGAVTAQRFLRTLRTGDTDCAAPHRGRGSRRVPADRLPGHAGSRLARDESSRSDRAARRPLRLRLRLLRLPLRGAPGRGPVRPQRGGHRTEPLDLRQQPAPDVDRRRRPRGAQRTPARRRDLGFSAPFRAFKVTGLLGRRTLHVSVPAG